MLREGEQGEVYTKVSAKEEVRKQFELPPKNNEMRRVFAYLMKHRYIDWDVISFFAREKLIYESIEQSAVKTKEYHNGIFVGYDEDGVPRHAHKKGVYTECKGFRGNIDSSNPCYSFHYFGSSDLIYVFEAPIDMLSFITIHKNSNSKVLCLDYDPAGIEACEKTLPAADYFPIGKTGIEIGKISRICHLFRQKSGGSGLSDWMRLEHIPV